MIKNVKIWCENRTQFKKVLEILEEAGVVWCSGAVPTKFADDYAVPTGLIIDFEKELSYAKEQERFNEVRRDYTTFSAIAFIHKYRPDTETELVPCDHCGQLVHDCDLEYVDGEYWCNDCLEDNTFICDNCYSRHSNDEMIQDNNYCLCQSCFDDYYYRCSDCGRIIHRDDTYWYRDEVPYCEYCYEELPQVIHDYYYKPEPIFYGDSKLYFGVELEVDKGGERDEHAERILADVNFPEEKLYCKHDGSLRNGFEMVSHPMTLEYHKNEMNWSGIMERAMELSYKSHDTDTCGLHIHVNRSGLGWDDCEREETISRIVYFIELHWNELLKFSRRTPETIERWARRYGLLEDTERTYKNAKENCNRYVCLNLQNRSTIEFRFFRGTLKHSTFLATLQLVNAICQNAIELSDKAVERQSWSDFVLSLEKSENSELIEYLKQKQLYVNEPTENNESEEM